MDFKIDTLGLNSLSFYRKYFSSETESEAIDKLIRFLVYLRKKGEMGKTNIHDWFNWCRDYKITEKFEKYELYAKERIEHYTMTFDVKKMPSNYVFNHNYFYWLKDDLKEEDYKFIHHRGVKPQPIRLIEYQYVACRFTKVLVDNYNQKTHLGSRPVPQRRVGTAISLSSIDGD